MNSEMSAPSSALATEPVNSVRRADGEERDHGGEADQVGDDAAPAPASVHAVRVEDLGDRVVAAPHDVVVDEVDRRPRDEQVEHQQQEVVEVAQEVVGGGERADQRQRRGEPDGERRGRRPSGVTRLNESIALISVSDPPYMFSAITETSPSAARISTIAPKPLKTWSPAALISAMPMPAKLLGRPRRRAPSRRSSASAAEGRTPVRPVEGLAHGDVRRQVARVVGHVDGPADLVARDDAELGEERRGLEAAEVERAGRVVQEEQRDR